MMLIKSTKKLFTYYRKCILTVYCKHKNKKKSMIECKGVNLH